MCVNNMCGALCPLTCTTKPTSQVSVIVSVLLILLTALNDAERPVIIWNLGGVYYLRWETRGVSTSPALSPCVLERDRAAALVLSLSIQHTRVSTSTYSIGKPNKGYKASRPST